MYFKNFLQQTTKMTNDLIDEYNKSTDKSRKKDLSEQIDKNIKYLKKYGKVTNK
jgi:hypothetical protein